MSGSGRRNPSLMDWFRENGPLTAFLASQLIAIFLWGIRTELQNNQQTILLNNLIEGQHQQDVTISRIEERGSRQVPNIELRLKQHEDFLIRLQGQYDNLAAHGAAVIQLQLDGQKERLNQNTQAIDALANIVNGHLRQDNIDRNRK